jgi:hypothetical protein
MNDDQQTFESKLAQLQPARLTRQQRQRLHNSIATRLAEAPARESFKTLFHWRPVLTWCGAAAAVVIIGMASSSSPRPAPVSIIGREQLALSNAWEVQERLLPTPDSSNVRENTFFISNSSSNLPQPIARKI